MKTKKGCYYSTTFLQGSLFRQKFYSGTMHSWGQKRNTKRHCFLNFGRAEYFWQIQVSATIFGFISPKMGLSTLPHLQSPKYVSNHWILLENLPEISTIIGITPPHPSIATAPSVGCDFFHPRYDIITWTIKPYILWHTNDDASTPQVAREDE